MNNKIILYFILIISYSASSQEKKGYQKGRMETRADSVARLTDSLINSNVLFHIEFQNQFSDDTVKYYRHYYIDTINNYLLKCSIDTTFNDYYERTFNQVVIYFNQGYEFKWCWNFKKGINSTIGSYSNIYPESYEIAQKIGKLEKNWTKESLDKDMKWRVRSKIHWSKFFQRRNRD